MSEFHLYVTELRKRKFTNVTKLAAYLKVSCQMWRKVERGINPPPRKSLLRTFCLVVSAKEYEQNQLYQLARRWEPHPDTNSLNHNLYHHGLKEDWTQAILEENTPDYTHRYWKPVL